MGVFRNNGNQDRTVRAACIALCIVLAVFMAGFLKWEAAKEAKESQRLEKLREEQKKQEGVKVSGETQQESAGEEGAPKENSGEEDAAGETQQAGQEETPKPSVARIAFWGNDFLMGQGSGQDGYPAKAQARLTEGGCAAETENWLLDSKSTLSIMKYAGVPDADIQAYISAHQAAGAAAGSPEVSVRSFTQEELSRQKSQDAMPVILMGYYGGWNNNTAELIEQEQKILSSLGKSGGPYLIVGLSPDTSAEGKAAFDAAMQQAWGDSYVSANGIQNAPESAAGQDELAALIADKLIRMEILAKGESSDDGGI